MHCAIWLPLLLTPAMHKECGEKEGKESSKCCLQDGRCCLAASSGSSNVLKRARKGRSQDEPGHADIHFCIYISLPVAATAGSSTLQSCAYQSLTLQGEFSCAKPSCTALA